MECFLLHFRNLVEFLAAPDKNHRQWSDDLTLTDHFDDKVGEQLRVRIQEIATPLRSYADLISKYLPHLTLPRHKKPQDWPANEMYFGLLPAIHLLRDALCLERWPDERPSSSAPRAAS